jgi:hypothetical protein
MKSTPATYTPQEEGIDLGRRNALRLAGMGIATLGVMPLIDLATAKAQDMSNGAKRDLAELRIGRSRSLAVR